MSGDNQSEVIDFLSDPATHGATEVERIDTHCAHVFLAGDTAWKVKRAVRYDYLDFSTLAKRRKILERELRLNSVAAPSLYCRVVPITRSSDGRLQIGGEGNAVEYALEMVRFPREAQLDQIAEAGGLGDALALNLGRAVADYHAAAEIRPEDGALLIREIVEELGRVFADMPDALGAEAVARFGARANESLDRLATFLTRRGRDGRVRRCHSDLHLANLVLIDGRPVPFDALEFDERLGTCDTAYDLAFLLMDLMHRDLARQGNLCMNRYLEITRDDEALAALPLFLAIRAAIRAMVDVQTAAATGSKGTVAAARVHLSHALSYLDPRPPRLIAIGGFSGTGKTTVAQGLAYRVGAAPGALHLRSDVERKALLGVAPLTRLPPSAYTAEISRQVHARLLARARTALAAGHSALLDATFLKPENRSAVARLGADLGVPVATAWLTAPAELLLSRVAARSGDASDADADVIRKQIAGNPGATGWPDVDASGPIPRVVELAAEVLRID